MRRHTDSTHLAALDRLPWAFADVFDVFLGSPKAMEFFFCRQLIAHLRRHLIMPMNLSF